MAVVTSLWTMFAVAFLAATVLPIGSEPLFVALVRLHPEQVPALLAVATLGNTLGGATSYWPGIAHTSTPTWKAHLPMAGARGTVAAAAAVDGTSG